MAVSCRLGARRISDDDRGEALAGQVRQAVRCNRLDRLAGVAARGARPGCRQDGSGKTCLNVVIERGMAIPPGSRV